MSKSIYPAFSQNPNGIPSHSPGLRATRYPGKSPIERSTPTGLCPLASISFQIPRLSFVPFCCMFLQ